MTSKTPAGTVANELLYRDDEARLEVVARARPIRHPPSVDGRRTDLPRIVLQERPPELCNTFMGMGNGFTVQHPSS